MTHQLLKKPFIAAMMIPTGVGASMGGFAGDATPALNLLASTCDVLITHPNVANAAGMQKLPGNALYVEGYGLDQFFMGRWALEPTRHPCIGVVLDAGIEPEMLHVHQNVLSAARSVYGLSILPALITEEPLDLFCEQTPSGVASGGLHNPQSLLQAAETLYTEGATAIAVCTQFPQSTPEMEAAYASGAGVDPIGGLEAILSHLIVARFQKPCAHAPVFSTKSTLASFFETVDPRSAAEYITPTFLPCVLTGLAQAPQFVQNLPQNPVSRSAISVNDVDALVVPANCLGGIPMLCALEQNIPLIVVAANQTVLDVDSQNLGLFLGNKALYKAEGSNAFNHDGLNGCMPKVIHVQSYVEAAGVLQALKLNLSLSLSGCLALA
jgi:hypothetical protein